MTRLKRNLMRYAPLVVGIILLVVFSAFIPWDAALEYLKKLTVVSVLALVALSMLFYIGRSLRYWLMLRMLNERTTFRIVLLSCIIAQPIAVLPGGELYRSLTLKRYGNVSLKTGTASVLAQALAETLGLAAIALIGTYTIHRYQIFTTIIAAIFVGILALINFRDGIIIQKIVSALPFVNFHHTKVRAYLRRNRILLSGRNFVVLFFASMVSTVAGIGIVAVAATAIGQSLSLPQAALVYALPTLFETVTFLPGGLGTNDSSSAAVLVWFGLKFPAAVAVTIIVRLSTLWIGFFYGFLAMLWAKFGNFPTYDES